MTNQPFDAKRDNPPPGLFLTLLPGRLAVCRLGAQEPLPDWPRGELTALTRTTDEISIVCAEECVPPGIQIEAGWRALKVAGPLDFSLTGILAAIAAPLAAAEISIFALSTYDTDYVLIKETHLADAIRVLSLTGHTIIE
jgi:hypothetical protein